MATIKRLIEKQNELLTQALTDFKGMGMTLKELKEQLACLDNEVREQNKSIYTLARVHTEVIRGIIFATGLNEDNGDKLKKGIKAGNKACDRIQGMVDEPKMTSEADLFSKAETPSKRTKKEVRDEAFSRNLISLDGLRIRYKVSKETIDAAVAYLGLDLATIEGSSCKYIDRAKIGEINDYLTKA